MVEGVDQAQSLIEKLLGLRVAGGDRMVEVSQSGHQSCRLGLVVGRMVLSESHTAEQHSKQNRDGVLRDHGSS